MRVWWRRPLFLVAAAAGCGRGPAEERASGPPPPPAAAIAPIRDSMSLAERLARLDAELAAAVRARLEGRGAVHLLRAEAITDRLLEVPPPFEWLRDGYLVGARLRQLQARADRIVSALRRGARPEALVGEAVALRREVRRLAAALAAGGGPPPPPLDSLLAAVPPDTGAAARVGEGAGE